MPSSNTSDLAQTLVGLAGKLGGAPTGSDTLESVTLGDTNGVDHLVLGEDLVGADLLLEALGDELDLVGGVLASVDLELHDVALLLAEAELAGLGVHNGAHDLGVLGDLLDLGLALLLALLGADQRSSLGEGLGLLAPALDEAALGGGRQVLSPHGANVRQTAGRVDVADQTNDNHRGSLEDGDSLDDLLLVGLGANAVQLAHNVGHTGLVGNEASQVHGLSLQASTQTRLSDMSANTGSQKIAQGTMQHNTAQHERSDSQAN